MPDVKSTRRIVMERLRERAETVRNGRYFVHRGALDWANFPFSDHPFAMSIMMDTSTFMRPTGIQRCRVSIEIVTSMPDLRKDLPGIDDGVMDELFHDMEEIVLPMIQEKLGKNRDGDALVLLVDREAEIIEISDAIRRLQGVTCLLNLEY